MSEKPPEGGSPATWRTSSSSLTGGEDVTPYDRVMLALNAQGFGGVRPKCPTCPPSKRRGFNVTAARTEEGQPTVVIKCFRGCDTMAEILPALGLDPADLYANANGQGRLFDAGRYSPVDRIGWLATPPSLARHLGVATTYGRFLSRNGSFGRVWASGDLVAVVHEPKHQKQARTASGLSANAWRKVVQRLAAMRMAHRCGKSDTTYFRHPMDACPKCGEILKTGPICPGNRSNLSSSGVASVQAREPVRSVQLAGSYELSKGPTEAVGEALELHAEEIKAATVPQIKPVKRCPECGGEAGCEPDCSTKPPLTMAEVRVRGPRKRKEGS